MTTPENTTPENTTPKTWRIIQHPASAWNVYDHAGRLRLRAQNVYQLATYACLQMQILDQVEAAAFRMPLGPDREAMLAALFPGEDYDPTDRPYDGRPAMLRCPNAHDPARVEIDLTDFLQLAAAISHARTAGPDEPSDIARRRKEHQQQAESTLAQIRKETGLRDPEGLAQR